MKMDVDDVKIGTLNLSSSPPFDSGIHAAKGIEEAGFDSVWWPDHLMGWVPDSLWTPDIVELADVAENPH